MRIVIRIPVYVLWLKLQFMNMINFAAWLQMLRFDNTLELAMIVSNAPPFSHLWNEFFLCL